MARLGAFCFVETGHINPITALARRLQERGHEVILFGIRNIEAHVRAGGVGFSPAVLSEETHLAAARRIQIAMQQIDGLEQASNIIEQAVKISLRAGTRSQ